MSFKHSQFKTRAAPGTSFCNLMSPRKRIWKRTTFFKTMTSTHLLHRNIYDQDLRSIRGNRRAYMISTLKIPYPLIRIRKIWKSRKHLSLIQYHRISFISRVTTKSMKRTSKKKSLWLKSNTQGLSLRISMITQVKSMRLRRYKFLHLPWRHPWGKCLKRLSDRQSEGRSLLVTAMNRSKKLSGSGKR